METVKGCRVRMSIRIALLALGLAALPAVCVHAADDTIQQTFQLAVTMGDVDGARRALEGGADVNARLVHDATALFWASRSGSPDLVELLLAKGAAVDAVDENGFSALHAAAYWWHSSVVEVLLRHGANANAASERGLTPLDKAVERLEHAEDVDSTPRETSDTGALTTVLALLRGGADAKRPGGSGEAPLLRVSLTDNAALADLLLDAGADIEVRGEDDVRPLYRAIQRNHARVAMRLIERGADVNATTKHGHTALMEAALQGNADLARVLIARKVDLNAVAKDIGMRPLDLALKVWKLSLEYTAEAEQHKVPRGRAWKLVARQLVDAGAALDSTGENCPPLYEAVMLGETELARAMVAHGAHPDDDKCGETALHAAIAEKRSEIAVLLVQAGANVNAPNMNGRTPLHFLPTAMNDEALAVLMIEHGGDVDRKDRDGRTPLDYARAGGADRVERVFREHRVR